MERGLTGWWVALIASGLAVAAGCGSGVGPTGKTVGATCSANGDCQERCVTGDDHYPGGICTVGCRSDADCPGGTVCIDDHDGMCAIACRDSADCNGLGRGFTCEGRSRVGATGDTLVCRVH